MKEITLEELKEIPNGQLFTIDTWDSDDLCYWTFQYMKTTYGYLYLGGGCDGGSAVSKLNTEAEVLEYANDNDYPEIKYMQLKEVAG